jgi:hypothetical protein
MPPSKGFYPTHTLKAYPKTWPDFHNVSGDTLTKGDYKIYKLKKKK